MSALLNGLMPALMMVVVQLAFAGLTVLYKLATNDGMDSEIIIAYRFIFAAALMIPLAFIVERFISLFNSLIPYLVIPISLTKIKVFNSLHKVFQFHHLIHVFGMSFLTFFLLLLSYNHFSKCNYFKNLIIETK